MTYEDVLKSVGTFGAYQKRLCFVIFCSTLTTALGTLTMIFTHYAPEHHCNLPANHSSSTGYEKLDFPPKTSLKDQRCDELISYNNSTFANASGQPCHSGWSYDEPRIRTVVTQFDLVCSAAWYKPLTVSLFMFGEMIGSFVGGSLSDRIGRRRILLVAKLFEFLTFFAIGFSSSVPMYIGLMTISGIFIYASYTTSFVLGNELMGTNHRNKVSFSVYGGYCFGAAIVPLFGYVFPDWHWLMRFTGLLGILYIPFYWLIPESPYWLLSSGNDARAAKQLGKVAIYNGNERQNNYTALFERKSDQLISKESNKSTTKKKGMSTMKLIVFSSTIRNRLAVAGLSWIVTNMVYYGLALNVSILSGDRYWNAAISGVLEYPGIITGFLVIQWIGRPLSLSVLMGLGGICLAVAPFIEAVSGGLMTALVLLGKTAIIGAFYINFSITGEMSPTLIRNTSIGITSAVGKIGSFTAPYLMFLGETTNRYLPFLVMGGLACTSAILTLLVLPETKDQVLPDSVHDAKQLRPWLSFKAKKTSFPESNELLRYRSSSDTSNEKQV